MRALIHLSNPVPSSPSFPKPSYSQTCLFQSSVWFHTEISALPGCLLVTWNCIFQVSLAEKAPGPLQTHGHWETTVSTEPPPASPTSAVPLLNEHLQDKMKKYYKWKCKVSQQQQYLCKNQRVKLTETPNTCTEGPHHPHNSPQMLTATFLST